MKRRFRGIVIGFPYYAKFLARLVNEHSDRWTLRAFDDGKRLGTIRTLLALRGADALISFGGPGPNAALSELARHKNMPVIVIWAGSDVIKAQDSPLDLQVIKQEQFYNISDGPWLVDELAPLGVHAEYEPLTAVDAGPPLEPFPSAFRVLTYLPEPRREFYGAPLVYDIARAMPDVEFAVVGAGSQSAEAPENVRFYGYVRDMQRQIDRSTVLLRVPQHDGKSMLVLEALGRGRHVVWNYQFPCVNTARTRGEILAKLAELRALHASGALPLNFEGRELVLANFGRKQIADRFEARLDAAMKEKQTRYAASKRRVAISGLDLFCAQASNNTIQYAPEWAPHFLRMSSRLEVLTSILVLSSCDVWYSIGSPIADRWVRLAARVLQKPRVLHWVGSDISSVAENKNLRSALTRRNICHLAEVTWTARQLRDAGIPATIAPLPPSHLGSAKPLPEKFTILLYLPKARDEFYGRSSYERLIRSLAGEHVRYLLVGGGEVTAPKNTDIEQLRWCHDLSAVYEQTSVLIRNTQRDGLSLMVLEALSYGRHVLWTQAFPHCVHINGVADIERQVRELLSAHRRGDLKPQAAASDWIQKNYDRETCTSQIVAAWDRALVTRTDGKLAVDTP